MHATDGGNPPLEGTTSLMINITDESDNVPTCDETAISVSIPETKPIGEQVLATKVHPA